MRYVGFDLETTGTDPYEDRIVELAVVPMNPRTGEPEEAWATLVNPGRPIPPGATDAHGITDEQVADAPGFEELADRVQRIVDDSVLVGYNSRRFDTVLLDAELRRVGRPGVDLTRAQEIDVYELWWHLEPRTLTGAVKRFLGRSFEDAHEAEADVVATIDVLGEVLRRFGLTLDEAVQASRPDDEVDRARKLVVNDDGEVCLNFGKHQGTPCRHIPLDYFKWMAKSDFPPQTMELLRELHRNGWRWPLGEDG